MSLEQFYEACHGDYEDVKGRLQSDDRVAKFVKVFMSDPTYKQLEEALQSGNAEEAFRASHTMKGLAANLGFVELYKFSDELTEALRLGPDGKPSNPEKVDQLMTGVNEAYRLIIESQQMIA